MKTTTGEGEGENATSSYSTGMGVSVTEISEAFTGTGKGERLESRVTCSGHMFSPVSLLSKNSMSAPVNAETSVGSEQSPTSNHVSPQEPGRSFGGSVKM